MEVTVTFEGLLEWDPTLIGAIALPTQTDAQTVKDALVFLGTDRCVLYADPDAMRGALAAYSALRLPSWQRIADAMELSYDPLENYDRHEEGGWKDANSGTVKNTGTNTNELSVQSYDSNTYQPRQKEVQTPDLTMTDTTAKERTFQSYRVHGNIGVTTSQQMLESEVNLALRVNIAEMIVRDILGEFTFGVY